VGAVRDMGCLDDNDNITLNAFWNMREKRYQWTEKT
jgi:hypothetical protein